MCDYIHIHNHAYPHTPCSVLRRGLLSVKACSGSGHGTVKHGEATDSLPPTAECGSSGPTFTRFLASYYWTHMGCGSTRFISLSYLALPLFTP